MLVLRADGNTSQGQSQKGDCPAGDTKKLQARYSAGVDTLQYGQK